MPLFSIIVPHYQGSVPHQIFCRGIESLKAQSFTDFELLCYHDGPLLDATLPMPTPIVATEKRYNDFGHSLRDIGIKQASGEYIVHMNADNILYPFALETIAAEIRRQPRVLNPQGVPMDPNCIIIFPVKMNGLQRVRGQVAQFKSPDGSTVPFYEIMTGNPPILQNIDAMQLVMRRDLWVAEGGWIDKRNMADGLMYPAFAKKYGYRTVGPVLGEHS